MQQNVKLCFARWLLAVGLLSQLCGVSVGNPVRAHVGRDSLNMEKCVSYSRALLDNVREALRPGDLFRGINCTEQNMELNTRTKTVSACEPRSRQHSSCPGYRGTKFNQRECLLNIMEDLQYYRSVLLAYPGHAQGSTLVSVIDELMEHCFTSSAPNGASAIMASPGPGNTFDERLKLCRVLKGFQVRAITINRVMGYIASGDYKI
ncbi:hypothetical protein MATL_G00242230 [Megalops atlanticus]|uniref:Interleukin-12 subunit alpha n=1 Tax=Megalops atlanticus TaxID=7932 RepID=A0A9D3PCD7_MEGAT|nr:hypothetical protein MATL_G00242230 [Megalops atlanticus]